MTRTGIPRALPRWYVGCRAVWLLLAFSVFCISAGLPASSSNTESPRKPFNLPSDGVERSLKRFSEQSGLQVVFSTDAVAGVSTRAVRGEMTSREALDAMLIGTGLEVVQESKSGAFTVRRRAARPNG